MMSISRQLLLAFGCALVLVTACSSATDSGKNTGGGQIILSSINISSAQQSVAPDDSVNLSARASYSDGSSRDLTDSVSWTSDNAAAVSVSDVAGTKGRAKAVGTGTAKITASYSGKQGTVSITAASVTGIAISPQSTSVDSGATTQLVATATIQSPPGGSVDETNNATWISSDTTIVKVNNGANKGRVTGGRAGTATISATWRGVTGQTNATSITIVSVTIANASGATPGGYFPIGGTLALKATATFGSGGPLDITDSVTWASSTSAVTINSTGTATRTGEDSTFVTARFHGVTGTALLHKSCVVLASGLTFDFTGGIGVGRLLVDAGGVVWFDYDPFQPGVGGAFRTVATTGGGVRTIKSGVPFVGQWDMDASYVYWMWVNTQGDQTYRIVRMNRANGAVDTLFNNGGIGGGARGLQVDANYIYYSPGDAGGIRRMPKGGGAATSFFAGSTFYPRAMSLSGGTVFGVDWDFSPALARALPTNGTAMDTLGNARPANLSLVDGSYFYWAENAPPSSRISRVAATGGAAVQTVVALQNVNAFTETGGFAYYSQTSSGSTLYNTPVSGGTANVVTDACGFSLTTGINPAGFATDGTYIYFFDSGGGSPFARVLRVKK